MSVCFSSFSVRFMAFRVFGRLGRLCFPVSQLCHFCTVVSNATSRLKESRALSRAPSTGQGVVKVNAGAGPVMGRARFSLSGLKVQGC